jgi:peptide/nickel transport system permease protein
MALVEPMVGPLAGGMPVGRRAGRVGKAQAARSRLRAGSKLDQAAIAVVVVVTVGVFFVPLLAPHSATLPIGLPYLSPGHGGALLGTDNVGRDILSRVLYGMRESWLAALGVIA